MSWKLHCFAESGHSYKAALALELAGLPWEIVFVDFFNGAARGDDFRAVNPMGEAPILEADGMVLSQSGAILQYITDQTGKLGGDPADKYEVLRWVLWDNHKLSSVAGITRFLANFLSAKHRNADVIAFHQGRLGVALKILDGHLQGRDWIVGKGVTSADLSCCSYLYYPEPYGFVRADFPNIDRWLSNISDLPGWKHPYDLMPRGLQT